MYQEFDGVAITALAACVPQKRVGNAAFENLLNPKEIRVFEKTVGILERRWAADGVTASDLGYGAALNLFDHFPVDRNEIDCLIFVSQTPDFKIPFTSNILQERLGLKREMLCLDINAGCAGFIQGLSTAFAMAKSSGSGKVLFIVAETLSKILSPKDRATTMLFGDGAAAILVEKTAKPDSKSFFNFFSDGANADAIRIPDGGYRSAVTAESLSFIEDEHTNLRNKLNLTMDGPKVFDFTLREIAKGIEQLLQKARLEKDAIDHFLLHQSNNFIIKQIASQLGVPAEKMLVNISQFGNTSGVSIPLVMSGFPDEVKKSGNLMLSGYGSGLNWGNAILNVSGAQILPLKEV